MQTQQYAACKAFATSVTSDICVTYESVTSFCICATCVRCLPLKIKHQRAFSACICHGLESSGCDSAAAFTFAPVDCEAMCMIVTRDTQSVRMHGRMIGSSMSWDLAKI